MPQCSFEGEGYTNLALAILLYAQRDNAPLAREFYKVFPINRNIDPLPRALWISNYIYNLHRREIIKRRYTYMLLRRCLRALSDLSDRVRHSKEDIK